MLLSLLTALRFAAELASSAQVSPFTVAGTMTLSNRAPRVTFHFGVPPGTVIYTDKLSFETESGEGCVPAGLPSPANHRDPLTGRERAGYERDFSAELVLGQSLPMNLVVRFQGCSNSACFFPERHRFCAAGPGPLLALAPASVPVANVDAPATVLLGGIDTNGFRLVARRTGYVPKAEFVGFLQSALAGHLVPETGSKFEGLGPIACLFLILAGGLGLNLTPCVLPMIPINLAIIGAGARAGSRRRGFALGGTYGLGMALAYGGLGLAVVLTGAKFGTLNSSPWFNLGIALIFLLLAFAMFDLVNLDFSRFQSSRSVGGGAGKGPFAAALGMGIMAALLAGACVAPVVISVLLLASRLYARGLLVGLLLPFFLGLGMALPWPFAGAGLSFLPKPGRWMKWVKYSFGVLIVLFAGYHGTLAWGLLSTSSPLPVFARSANSTTPAAPSGPVTPEERFARALQEARAEGRPVLIDFAASWCKNCEAMDAGVYRSAEVKAQLKSFAVIRYDAEKPNEPPARDVMNLFGVMGLPTCVVLLPQ